MIDRSIDIEGLSIRYLATAPEASEMPKTPLIILHGWGVTADHWRGVLECLEKAGFAAFAPDLPGFGKSQAPARGWSLLDYEMFVEHFSQALNLPLFALLGHSFGGRVAIMVAWKTPQKLSKFILVDSAGVTPRNKLRLAAYRFFTKVGKYIFTLAGLRLLRKPARKIIYWVSGTYDYYAQTGSMRETFQNVIGKDLTPYLKDIKTPTLILWGAQDRMTPVSDAHILHKGIAGSALRIFEDMGHSGHVANPSLIADEIAQFMKHT